MAHFLAKLCLVLAPIRNIADPTPPPVANCTFKARPSTLYSWDESCLSPDGDKTGCNADGVHKACRFCGESPYPACPSCTFEVEPETPAVWDSNCGVDGVSRGCYADGVHRECRFCGVEGYDACPVGFGGNSTGGEPQGTGSCSFKTEPTTPYTWDTFCGRAGHERGCFADGVHRECKFCGFDDYEACPGEGEEPRTAASLRGAAP
eukprot:gb/GFBE01043641.1/.p1 GENE.gb/GFBE01043641.1/~~gb/GFBE01043641.1/.p1  ORF type:complete len:206 (+),score=34.66 gb/GFBE01043641.1/:1-618(+)